MAKHFWNGKYQKKMERLAQEGVCPTEVAKQLGISYDSMYYHARKTSVEFKNKDMNGVPKPRNDRPILSYDTTDPRSFVCQQIQICNGQGCHRKDSCPAHEAYNQKGGIFV
jgi:hypothetical protein